MKQKVDWDGVGQVPARTVWEKKKPTQSEVGWGIENPPHTCPVAIPTPRVGVEEGVVDYCLFLPMSDTLFLEFN